MLIPSPNIFAPENQWLEDELSFGLAYFLGLLLLVLGSVNLSKRLVDIWSPSWMVTTLIAEVSKLSKCKHSE